MYIYIYELEKIIKNYLKIFTNTIFSESIAPGPVLGELSSSIIKMIPEYNKNITENTKEIEYKDTKNCDFYKLINDITGKSVDDDKIKNILNDIKDNYGELLYDIKEIRILYEHHLNMLNFTSLHSLNNNYTYEFKSNRFKNEKYQYKYEFLDREVNAISDMIFREFKYYGDLINLENLKKNIINTMSNYNKSIISKNEELENKISVNDTGPADFEEVASLINESVKSNLYNQKYDVFDNKVTNYSIYFIVNNILNIKINIKSLSNLLKDILNIYIYIILFNTYIDNNKLNDKDYVSNSGILDKKLLENYLKFIEDLDKMSENSRSSILRIMKNKFFI